MSPPLGSLSRKEKLLVATSMMYSLLSIGFEPSCLTNTATLAVWHWLTIDRNQSRWHDRALLPDSPPTTVH